MRKDEEHQALPTHEVSVTCRHTMSTTADYVIANDTMTTAVTLTTVNFIAILPIMAVVGVMFGTTIVVIVLVSLWPRKRKGRRTENIQMQDLDSIYAELDNKSISTTMTRVTSEISIDSETEIGAFSNRAYYYSNHGTRTSNGSAMVDKERTGMNNKKVRFSDHQIEIPGEPHGRPRSKLYIDVR